MTDRWDPLDDLSRVQRKMNQLFDSALARAEYESGEGLDGFRPAANVWKTASGWRLDLELPGRNAADLDIQIDGEFLVVRGREKSRQEHPGERFHRMERIRSGFTRRFRIPEDIARKDVRARYDSGVLSIEIPKLAEASGPAIQVKID